MRLGLVVAERVTGTSLVRVKRDTMALARPPGIEQQRCTVSLRDDALLCRYRRAVARRGGEDVVCQARIRWRPGIRRQLSHIKVLLQGFNEGRHLNALCG